MNAIYFSDLSLKFFPNSSQRSAVTQLHRWIEINEELKIRLNELYFRKRQRALTPLQHQAIIEHLGEP